MNKYSFSLLGHFVKVSDLSEATRKAREIAIDDGRPGRTYRVKVAVAGEVYTIIGHKGKQVRDQIHSYDVINAFNEFVNNPHPGEVYNLGGGRDNNASVLECIAMIEEKIGKEVRTAYVEKPRSGDHICYITDFRKLQSHYPSWRITRSLESIIDEIIEAERNKH